MSLTGFTAEVGPGQVEAGATWQRTRWARSRGSVGELNHVGQEDCIFFLHELCCIQAVEVTDLDAAVIVLVVAFCKLDHLCLF